MSGKSATASAAVTGTNSSTAASAIGTLGVISSTTPGASSAGVWGENNGTNDNGIGVYGSHASGGTGVYGAAGSGGIGVSGTGFLGVTGSGTLGGDFFGDTTSGTGNFGVLGQGDQGVVGYGTTYGGAFDGLYGVSGQGNSNSGNGGQFFGYTGVYGNGAASGVYGEGGTYGGYFISHAPAGSGLQGVFGLGDIGLYGAAIPGGSWAAVFEGDVSVLGNLSKYGGSFKIDHPLDPAHKYLYHSFVESPDMLNIYNGIAVLDAAGQAVVYLPDWFGALNRDFRYQLTPIGAAGPGLYIAQEVANNQFTIAGGTPGMKVSWQMTGIRQDPWANAHRIPVEEDKPAKEQGTYLYPQGYGAANDKGIGALYRGQAPKAPAPPKPPTLPKRPQVPTPPTAPAAATPDEQ